MLAQFQAHGLRLSEDPTQFFPPKCPSCQQPKALRVHELRQRGLWFTAAQEVKRVAIVVLRVSCKICQVRSTVLPEFALPHKRYVRSEVVARSEHYLRDESATYESASWVDARPVFHDADGSSRAASTVYRWVSFLGSLALLLSNATRILCEADPAHSPLGETRPIAASRYRSTARREVLDCAHRLLYVRTALRTAVEAEIFPSIATAAAWS